MCHSENSECRSFICFLKNTKDAIIGEEGTVTTISKASLEKVFEISELSTVDYSYNAVARAYEEDGATPKYYVAYEGTVTAGIDFSKIVIDIDEDTKIITITLPESEIQNTTVDFGSMDYILKIKNMKRKLYHRRHMNYVKQILPGGRQKKMI